MSDEATLTPTEEQAARFRDLSASTMTALSSGKTFLEQKMLDEPDPAAKAGLLADVAEIEAHYALVRSRRLAFEAKKREIRPPTAEEVRQAKSLAARLDNVVATQAAAASAVDIATKLFSAWQQTQT